jgi:predicted acylesterase/phospholipase RssA/CRP-like cAMP-binding protein
MLSQAKLSYLFSAPLFQAIDQAVLVELMPHLESVFLPGGETLFRTGDLGDSMYIVLSGRLRVYLEHSNGTVEVIREIARGESVGELALLTGKPRSATVRAIRDSELAKLARAAFENTLKRYPQLVGSVTTQIADRQSQGIDRTLSKRTVRTIAVLPVGRSVPLADFAARLADALKIIGPTLLLNKHSGDLNCGTTAIPIIEDGQVRARLSELESDHRFIVYEADAVFSSWTQRCIRQADLILIVTETSSVPTLSSLEVVRGYFSSGQITADIELVLLHNRNHDAEVKTDRWLSVLPVNNHHHVITSSIADLNKLVRLLTGTAVGLVLSGGGARGFAHIGVIRALYESGIPIDAIGGTSMGAVIAAQHALGWDWQTMARVNQCEWPRCEPQKNYTLPLVALNSGKRMDQMLRRVFEGAEIENLKTRYFCVSTNLTRADAMIHHRGTLWKAVRASVSIPGVGPPAIENGEILVDGGLINNLPVDVMKKLCQGFALAVDVSEQLEFKSKLTESYTLSGWKLLWQRLNPFSERPDIPNILNILYRTTTVGSIRCIESAKNEADLYLNPPVSKFGVFDWSSIDKIIDAGYQDTLRRLEQCDTAAFPRHVNPQATD